MASFGGRKGARLRVIPMNERGELILEEYENMLNERTRIVAITHVSNSLGTINPVKEMIATAHKFGVPVLVDGAQAVPHFPVDVQDLDADFTLFPVTKFSRRPVRACFSAKRMARQNAAVSNGRRNDSHRFV